LRLIAAIVLMVCAPQAALAQFNETCTVTAIRLARTTAVHRTGRGKF
jgi:hypothetical protein